MLYYNRCFRLRSVLLEIPTLWTNISLNFHPELRDIFHARTRGLPLHVRTDKFMGPNEHHRHSVGNFLSENIKTISSLLLTWHSGTSASTGWPKLTPFLEKHIGTTSFPQLKHAAFFDKDYDFHQIFGYTITINAPKLESLVLEAMVLNPTTLFPFPHLTNIHIQKVITFADEIIPLLAVCPALEFCWIDAEDMTGNVDEERWEGLLPNITTLHLPALKVLRMDMFVLTDTLKILQLLPHSPNARIRIELTTREFNHIYSEVLLQLLELKIRHFDQLVVRQTWGGRRESNFRLCSVEESSLSLGHHESAGLEIGVPGEFVPTNADVHADPLVPLFSILPTGIATHLSSLHLVNSTTELLNPNDDEDGIATLPTPALLISGFRYLPHLKMLKVAGWMDIDDLLEAFILKGLDSSSESDVDVDVDDVALSDHHLTLCPSLRHFEFQDSYFTPELLIQFLQERHRAGVRVGMLRVTGGLLDERSRSIVRALVLDFVEDPPNDLKNREI